ncbi:hypothetical protein QN277_000849 [Acacia crassicarpa]|uniref:Uncharacterized protein n=1 Tax=Acacia crassicarpa TaxID=499986 RepID=A0AAE1TG28_9FABA|nr:hypothetical protein QN277_000849 [Acacia crassicarpa]
MKRATGSRSNPSTQGQTSSRATAQRSQASSRGQASSQAIDSAQNSDDDVPPIMENAISDIYQNISPPEGFVSAPSAMTREENDKFREAYLHRDFCPIVAVNLSDFFQENHLDLSPWLKQYENFVSISAPYTPHLVCMFYCNMEYDNELGPDGELLEERVTTMVRGVKFTLSTKIINKILKVVNPPPIPEFSYNNQEVFETLRPDKPFPPNQQLRLTFNPGSMSPENRVLWYVYSRNFIQKGGNFTHFT